MTNAVKTRSLVVPSAFNNPNLATLAASAEPILTNGSLILFDPAHPWKQFPDAAYNVGSLQDALIPNLAWAQAAATIGQGSAGTLSGVGVRRMASPYETSTPLGSEKTAKGGLHIASSPTASVSNEFAGIMLPQLVSDYIAQNTMVKAAMLNQTIVSGTTYTTLTVQPLPAALEAGSYVSFYDPANPGTHALFEVGNPSPVAGATTLPVFSTTPTVSLPSGAVGVLQQLFGGGGETWATAGAHEFYIALSHYITNPSVTPYSLFSGIAASNSQMLYAFNSWEASGGSGTTATDQPPSPGSGVTNTFQFANRSGTSDDTIAGLVFRSRAVQGPYETYDAGIPFWFMAMAFGAGAHPNWTGGTNNVRPSHILYSYYVEDLTVSGRTPATVDALALARHNALFAAGGRYNGDVWTTPATLA